MRHEVLVLVGLVLLVDVLFVAGYFLFRLPLAGGSAKLGYTVAWTVATLFVVLRGLTRIRSMRGRRTR